MITLSGVSCSGKSTILKQLALIGYDPVISYTTRPMRDGEQDGVDYHYITNDEFEDLKAEGFFAETTEYNIDSNKTWMYGTAKRDLSDNKIAILNPDGLKTLRSEKGLNIVSFLLIADDVTIWNRLRQRGDDSIEANRRIKADKEDFSDINSYVDFAIRTDNDLLNINDIANLIDEIYRRVSDNE